MMPWLELCMSRVQVSAAWFSSSLVTSSDSSGSSVNADMILQIFAD
jgi:hypothetical protein